MKRSLFAAIINVHREGEWAYRAVRSAIVALNKLIEARPNETAEIVVVADKADDMTLACVHDALKHFSLGGCITWRVIYTDHGDLGLARNSGVAVAGARFIGFLDGDDIWGQDWPLLGVAQLERETAEGKHVVAHPRVNVDFGEGAFWWTQPDQRSTEFDPATFWTTNCWSSGAMSAREVFQFHPYRSRGEGLGFEDWEWNARTVAAGVLHVAVHGAVVFIRKKSDGLNVESARKNQVIAYSPYFDIAPAILPTHGPAPEEPALDAATLIRQWKAAHRIEPAIWPDARLLQSLPRYTARPEVNVPRLAFGVRAKVKTPPTHVIFAPFIRRGGADKRVIEYATAVVRAGGRPLVILTDGKSNEEWVNNIPENVQVLDCTRVFPRAGAAAAQAMLRVLMDWRCSVHVINSKLGYVILRNFAAALKENGNGPLFCSSYGSEEAGGRLGGAAFNGMFEGVMRRVTAVISDNAPHIDELRGVLGWRGRATVAPTPIAGPDMAAVDRLNVLRASSRLAALRVLWASRIVGGKRLDRLAAVARLAHERKLPIVFAVAGEVGDAKGQAAVDSLRKLPNVKVAAKAFNGWAELAPHRQDLFMFTSESEGMPNIVLEAMAHGLQVVASNVGGLVDTPRDAVTLIDTPDDPEAWLAALFAPATGGLSGMRYVAQKHSRAAFDAALKDIGYFNNIGDHRGESADNGSTQGNDPGAMAGSVEAADGESNVGGAGGLPVEAQRAG